MQSRNNYMSDRPPIPDPMKREIRRRCGFGCVICGSPIYDYEHMLEWAQVERHVASEITLLCPRHHRAKTSGRLPSEDVKKANKEPFNLRGNTLSTYDELYYSGDEALIVMGDSTFKQKDMGSGSSSIILFVKGQVVISVKLSENHFFINLNLFDNENNKVLEIVDNEMRYSVGLWDVEYVGRRLILREESRKIFIDIEFITPNILKFNRGKFYCNGHYFEIKGNNFQIDGKLSFYKGVFEQQSIHLIIQ